MLKHLASRRPSPAMIVALIALIVALGGTSIAAFKLKKNSVGTKQLKADAVTGDKALESSFGKVPSAAKADNATNATNATNANNALNADNADAVGGFTSDELVVGNGSQFAFSSPIPNGMKDGLSFGGVDELVVLCSATPNLSWDNDFNDPGAPVTHIFAPGGVHVAVTDGAATTPVVNNLNSGSQDIEVSTGDGLVISARLGVFWTGTQCLLSLFANIEPDAAAGLNSGSSRDGAPGPRPGDAGRL